MDALVFVSRGTVGAWDIYARDPKDLHLGTIRQDASETFSISPDAEALTGVRPGPYTDLDAAIEAVGQQLGGTCQMWSP